MAEDLALVRLLQLASPVLPVGAYTYSQALERAVHDGFVDSETGAARWIGDLLTLGIARWEAPALAALLRAWRVGNDPRVMRLDREYVASRETAELRAETLQMGHSLKRLLSGLDAFTTVAGYSERLAALREPSYPTVWSAAAAAWAISEGRAVQAYLWSWLENQVMAAVKTIPLGQSAAQRLLAELGGRIPALAREALTRHEASFCNLAPAFAIASALHETQYTRLFRS